MVFLFWEGRGWWVTWLVALGMFLPMLILWQVDGPGVDRGVALAMGLAAIIVLCLGFRWNRRGTPGQPARHSFWGLPLQYWAVPMAVFAVLLGTGTITTAEEPRVPRGAVTVPAGGLK